MVERAEQEAGENRIYFALRTPKFCIPIQPKTSLLIVNLPSLSLRGSRTKSEFGSFMRAWKLSKKAKFN